MDLGTPHLRWERDGSVAWLTIDRPERRNAMTPNMYFGIRRAVDRLNHSPDLHALVITGTAQLWHVYAFALLLGIVTAIDTPARQAFVSELVPDADLPNAVVTNQVRNGVAVRMAVLYLLLGSGVDLKPEPVDA